MDAFRFCFSCLANYCCIASAESTLNVPKDKRAM